MTRALFASSAAHSPDIGDPERDGPRRWPTLAALAMPVMSWCISLEAADLEAADELEAFLASSADVHELQRDAELSDVLRAPLRIGSGPRVLLEAVHRLADARAIPEEIVVRVDLSDPLAACALDCTAGADDETAAVRLLADDTARGLMAFVQKHVPPAMRHRLAPQVRAACAREILDLRLARAAALEMLVDLETAAEEARVREALEAPTRAAAARLAGLAADARRKLAAELDACAADLVSR